MPQLLALVPALAPAGERHGKRRIGQAADVGSRQTSPKRWLASLPGRIFSESAAAPAPQAAGLGAHGQVVVVRGGEEADRLGQRHAS